MADIEIRVDFAPTGECRILVPDGQVGVTKEMADAAVRRVAAQIKAERPNVQFEDRIEQHSHGPKDVFAHDRVRTR